MSTDPIRNQVDELLEQAVPLPATDGWERPIPFEEAPLPEFPVRALGPDAGRFVAELARAYQVPTAMPAMLMLVAASTAVAKKREVVLRPGWKQPLNLYVLVAMSPGERKTSVLRATTAPISRWEERVERERAPAVREARAREDLAEGRLREAKQRYAREKDADVRKEIEVEVLAIEREIADADVPTLPRLRVDDVTPEKLGQVMRDNGGRIAILGSEGGILDILAGRYDKSGRPNLDLVLKGWDGQEPWVRDRVSDVTVRIERPVLTLGLAIQPDVIQSMAGHKSMKDRGLIGRMLFAVPRSLVGSRNPNPDPADDQVMAWWDARLTALLDLEDERDEQGETKTRAIELDDAAQARLVDYQVEVEALLGEGGALDDMGDWGGKLVGHVGRIAAVLHLIEGEGSDSVGVDHVDRAVEVGRFLIPHAQAAYALLDADPDADGAKKLLRWIRRKELSNFTSRDALEGISKRYRSSACVERSLNFLVERGYVRAAEMPAQQGRGRPTSPVFEVNPLVHASNQPAQTAQMPAEPISAVSAGRSKESGVGADDSGDDAEAQQ